MKKILSKLARFLPDKLYISLMYFKHFKRFPNLKNPRTFNEKMQWLKLYDRRPEYITIVDKHLVKQYIADKIGEQHVIPTLGFWESADQIDFDALPDQFVLKWNHGGGGSNIIICRDKASFDRNAAIDILKKGQNNNTFWYGREWPYKNVKPLIIAEMYMENVSGSGELTDYKIHCYNGVPKAVQVISNRFGEGGMRNDYFIPDTWENYGLRRGNYSNSTCEVKRPAEVDKLLELSRILAKDYPFVRVDFYIVNHEVYFGELTLYPASGFNPFTPHEYDKIFGSWIDLGSNNSVKG